MSSQKKGSKARFLYLFDWRAKSSRKKLFTSISESSEGSNQGKENIHNFEAPHLFSKEALANRDASVVRGSGTFSGASSVNGDDEHGTKAPGVVARLMGLDSLPTTTTSDSSSTSLHDDHTLDKFYYPRHASDLRYEQQILDYSYAADTLERIPWNSMESRLSKVRRPIDRFQTEILPPKSAKSISITHHKLLSPIKSPGFIPTRDPSCIMEAAARIIDHAPGSPAINRVSSFGSSLTPMRLQHPKEKINAANRSSSFPESSKKPKHEGSVNQTRLSSCDRSDHLSLFKASLDMKRSGSRHSVNKGKAISSTFQSEDNSCREDEAASSNNRSQVKKEHMHEKLKQSITSQRSTLKTEQIRMPANKSANVLRQNDEKQNRVSHKDEPTSKTLAPNQQIQYPRKAAPANISPGHSKIVNKVFVKSENGSKKVVSASITKKNRSLTKMNNIARNKELAMRDSQPNDTVADSPSFTKDETPVQHNSSFAEDYKRDMDVISFTFTSPIKRCSEVRKVNHHFQAASHDSIDQTDPETSLSPVLRLKLIGEDTLSLLLEQKLKELTEKVESSQSDSVKESSGAESITALPDSVSRMNAINSAINSAGESDDLSAKCDLDVVRDDDGSLEVNQKWKDFGSPDGCSTSCKCVFREEPDLGSLDHLLPECSLVDGKCVSSKDNSGYIHGREQILIFESKEETICLPQEFHAMEDEDFSDSASSMYNENNNMYNDVGNHTTRDGNSTYWELEYVRHILHHSTLKDLGLNENCNIIPFRVFDMLENLLDGSGRNEDDSSKLWRKILFDCVNECVSMRYHCVLNGSYNSWTKWLMLLQHEDWLAEDLCREVIGLKDMGHLMVDELVGKDMGTQYGGWLDFEIEALEEGAKIETDIMNFLVDDLVVDLCSFLLI